MYGRYAIAFFLLVCIGSFTECRKGWKTSKNGYFIYKATSDASLSETLKVNGTFSVKQYSRNHNVLLAVEDSSGNLSFQVSFDNGWSKITTKDNSGVIIHSKKKMQTTNFGFPFSFEVIFTQKNESSRYLKKAIQVRVLHSEQMTQTWESYEGAKWNLENATLYIGGYKSTGVRSGDFFEGCISGVMFQGIDIIGKYFQQYPSNTNPVRGSGVVGAFSNVSQTCDDKNSSSLGKTPCWKTDDKCGLSYKLTPVKSNNVILNFTMKFSTKIFSQKKNVLFAIEDADGKFALQISIETEFLQARYFNTAGGFTTSGPEVLGVSSGAVISQEMLIKQDNSSQRPYLYYEANPMMFIKTTLVKPPNFANVTVYVGGYNKPDGDGGFFDDCIHSAFVNGVDVVGTYLSGGSQKIVTKDCFLKPTLSPTTKPSDANLVAVASPLLIFMLAVSLFGM